MEFTTAWGKIVDTTARKAAGAAEQRLNGVQQQAPDRTKADLASAIAETTARQQREIGSELHDLVSQHLAGVRMMAEALRQEMTAEASPHAPLAEKLVRYLGEVQRNVRQISRGLTPAPLNSAGLMSALEQLACQCIDLYGVQCIFHCQPSVTVDNEIAATQLYYLAREAVHNAVKHGGPKQIVVRLEQSERSTRLQIEDDGEGMDLSATRTGLGLTIMNYRAGAIGGTFDVQSAIGRGTTVTCALPFGK